VGGLSQDVERRSRSRLSANGFSEWTLLVWLPPADPCVIPSSASGCIRLGALFCLGAGPLIGPTGLSAQAAFRVDTAVAVPMRDGVVLRADLWRPTAAGRYPTLVYRTPYGRGDTASSGELVVAAVRRGYAVVLQDVRGRYGSAGEFDPYRH